MVVTATYRFKNLTLKMNEVSGYRNLLVGLKDIISMTFTECQPQLNIDTVGQNYESHCTIQYI